MRGRIPYGLTVKCALSTDAWLALSAMSDRHPDWRILVKYKNGAAEPYRLIVRAQDRSGLEMRKAGRFYSSALLAAGVKAVEGSCWRMLRSVCLEPAQGDLTLTDLKALRDRQAAMADALAADECGPRLA